MNLNRCRFRVKGKDRIWRRLKNSLLTTLELFVCVGGADEEEMRDADETFSQMNSAGGSTNVTD